MNIFNSYFFKLIPAYLGNFLFRKVNIYYITLDITLDIT